MNLDSVKFNTYKYNSLNKTTNNLRMGSPSTNLSFSGTYEKIINGACDVTYTNISAIQKEVDKILGDNFLSSTLQKAGLKPENDAIRFNDKGFFKELATTVAYPFVKMPLDIANSVLNAASKVSFLEDAANSLKNAGPLARRYEQVQQQKNYECAKALLDRFASDKCIVDRTQKASGTSRITYNFENSLEVFKDRAATDIVDLAKNYSSRDERALNRMATLTVSATYSARDFYNISMLQKDDHKEAKKAERARLKQELTRMIISAGTTFVSLGVFNKFTKGNVLLNSLVIAGSALVSEIGSRLINKTPLVPLSPDRAAALSQKDKEKKQNNNVLSNFINSTNSSSKSKEKQNLGFKGNSNQEKELFKNFETNANPMNIMKNQDVQNEQKVNKQPKKKSKVKTVLAALFAGASIMFLAKKALGGEYARKILDKKNFEANSEIINSYLDGMTSNIDSSIVNAAKKAKNDADNTFINKISDRFNDFIETIKYRQVRIDASEIEKRTKELQKLPEAKEIKTLLDEYVRQAKAIEKKAQTGEKGLTIYIKRELIGGIYSGCEKLIKTLYQIFSLPGAIVDGIVHKIFFKQSEQAIEGMLKKASGAQIKVDIKTRKGMSQYAQVIFDNQEKGREFDTLTKKLRRKRKTDEQIIENIKKNTRNFEIGAETGALANLSRTMVTFITTYFFVNDYRNRVLIESAGKDIETANEVGRERAAHKASNFVINGAMMNIFNSVFKKPLNASLIGAAAVASATEMTNEFMVRKSICQPVRRMKSRQEILDYEQRQENRKGIFGAWSRLFRKITGKKNLSQKVQNEK